MQNLTRRIFKSVLLVGCLVGILSLTGCGKKNVNLNDYLTITEKGYNGYGSVSVSLDYEQLIADNQKYLNKNLNSEHFGSQTPELAAQMVFGMYDPYVPAADGGNELKNGDKVEITWNTNDGAIDKLSQVMKIKCSYKNTNYTVKGLEDVKEVDPFEKLNYHLYGKNGEGSITSIGTYVNIGTNEDGTINWRHFTIKCDGKNLSNGDKVLMKLDLDANMADYMVRSNGIKFTRTEAELEVNGFNYLSEDAEEIFAGVTDEALGDYTEEFIKFLQKDTDAKNYNKRTAELVDMVYYCGANGQKGYSFNTNNQLVFIYHISDGDVPDGWYAYYAPNNDVMMVYDIQYTDDNDMVFTKYTGLDVNSKFNGGDWYNKREEVARNWWSGGVIDNGHMFQYNGLWYPGHKTIEETIAAFEKEYGPMKYFNNKYIYSQTKN